MAPSVTRPGAALPQAAAAPWPSAPRPAGLLSSRELPGPLPHKWEEEAGMCASLRTLSGRQTPPVQKLRVTHSLAWAPG